SVAALAKDLPLRSLRPTVDVELRQKPVSNQPEMLRLVPRETLPPGIYQLGEGIRFVPGYKPKGYVSPTTRPAPPQVASTVSSAVLPAPATAPATPRTPAWATIQFEPPAFLPEGSPLERMDPNAALAKQE